MTNVTTSTVMPRAELRNRGRLDFQTTQQPALNEITQLTHTRSRFQPNYFEGKRPSERRRSNFKYGTRQVSGIRLHDQFYRRPKCQVCRTRSELCIWHVNDVRIVLMIDLQSLLHRTKITSVEFADTHLFLQLKIKASSRTNFSNPNSEQQGMKFTGKENRKWSR